VLASGLIYFTFQHWGYDDPYITYRYAQNLAAGRGFVYNLGSHFLSTTSPLFALLLGGIEYLWSVAANGRFVSAVAFSPRNVANLIGAFSLVIGGVFLRDLILAWKTANTPSTRLVSLASLLLYPTFPLLVSTLSSEIPLYLALCIGCFVFYAHKRYLLTSILAALVVLIRPDGALVPLLLALHFLFTLRRAGPWSRSNLSQIPWQSVAVFLTIILCWMVFAQSYFGSPLPITLAAKQHQGAMVGNVAFAPGLLNVLKWFTSGGLYRRWPYLLAAILAIIGLIYTAVRSRQWVLFWAWGLLYFGAYAVLGVAYYFWYYAPLVPGFIAALGLGLMVIAGLGQSANRDDIQPKSDTPPILTPRSGTILLTITLTAIVLTTQVLSLWDMRQNPDNRLDIYREVGEWLASHTPIDATIGTLETGMIGYYSQRTMLDFGGLLFPDVAAQLGATGTFEDAAFYIVKQYHPDYLVLQQGLFPDLEQNYAALNCWAIQTFTDQSTNESAKRSDSRPYAYPIIIYHCP
jgi:hypothetical protein